MTICNLKFLRKSKGLTQQDLSNQVGISLPTIKRLEVGTMNISKIALDTALKMCEVLGCTPYDLYTNQEEQTNDDTTGNA